MVLTANPSASDRERSYRSQMNRRGRKNPASVPSKLTRTSAFQPKRQGLITDRKFECTYEVPGGSVVTVRGGELGTQHRDVLYAVMRLKAQASVLTNKVTSASQEILLHNDQITYFHVSTTWRQLITSMNNLPHKANLRTLLNLLEDLKQVSIRVEEGTYEEIISAKEKGELAGAGYSSNVIHDIRWSGKSLDDDLQVVYGNYVRDAIESNFMVSLNADVQFKLKNDHAKSFWPYIDSQNRHHWIDEDRLAALAGRDLWSEQETSKTRNNFRVTCRKAFEDMVNAGGLKSFEIQVRGVGRKKSRRYQYTHALARQVEKDLAESAALLGEKFEPAMADDVFGP